MDAIFEKFTPGEYLPFEAPLVEQKKKDFADVLAGKAPMPPAAPAAAYSEADVLAYNKKWDPYNPLFNDPEYAKKAGYPGVPAAPGFTTVRIPGVRPFPKNISDGGFYYTNDGSDIRLSRPVTAGDLLTPSESKPMFEEVTIPGSECREWIMGGIGTLVDDANGQTATFPPGLPAPECGRSWLAGKYKDCLRRGCSLNTPPELKSIEGNEAPS